MIAGTHAQRIARQPFDGGLDDEAWKPLLWIDSERQQARAGRNVIAGENASAAEQFLSCKLAQPALISLLHSLREVCDQLGVQICDGCTGDG